MSNTQQQDSESFYAQADKDTWQTPPDILEAFEKFDPIHTDPCAGPNTSIGRDFNWTINHDGLSCPWVGTAFVNPPFSDKGTWLAEVLSRIESGEIERAYVLLPDSTDVQSWWHGQIVPNANYVWFSEGRVKFVDPETGDVGKSPTGGTCISMFGSEPPESLQAWFQDNGWLVQTVR